MSKYIFLFSIILSLHGVFAPPGHGEHECTELHEILHQWVKAGHLSDVDRLLQIPHHYITAIGKRGPHEHEHPNSQEDLWTYAEAVEKYYKVTLECVKQLESQFNRYIIKPTVPTKPTTTTTAQPPITVTETTTTTTTQPPTTEETFKMTTEVPTTYNGATFMMPQLRINPNISCNGKGILDAFVGYTVQENLNAGVCTNGKKADSEALLENFCSAPEIYTWRPARKVMDYCQQIPMYTPVGTFTLGSFVQNGRNVAGVFTNCTGNGFEMIVQLCGHPPERHSTQQGSTFEVGNADNYFIIEW